MVEALLILWEPPMKKKDIYILLVFALSRLTNDALLAKLTPERGQTLASDTKKSFALERR
jgi:hypothetical protein